LLIYNFKKIKTKYGYLNIIDSYSAKDENVKEFKSQESGISLKELFSQKDNSKNRIDKKHEKLYKKKINAIFKSNTTKSKLKNYIYYKEPNYISNRDILVDIEHLNLIELNYQLKTDIGDAYIIFDFNENNLIEAGEQINTLYLFKLDENFDAVLDKNDRYFHKIKLLIEDNLEYKMFRLSDIKPKLDLRELFKDDLDEFAKAKFLETLRPKYRYLEILDFDELFIKLDKNEDGWIGIDDGDEALDFLSNLAYQKSNFLNQNYIQPNIDLFYEIDSKNQKRYSNHLINLKIKKNLLNDYIESLGVILESFERVLDKNKIENQNDLDFIKTHNSSENFENNILEFESNELIFLKKQFFYLTHLELNRESLKKAKEFVKSFDFKTIFVDYQLIIAIKRNIDKRYTIKYADGTETVTTNIYKNYNKLLEDKNKNRLQILFNSEIVAFDESKKGYIDRDDIDFKDIVILSKDEFTDLETLKAQKIEYRELDNLLEFEIVLKGEKLLRYGGFMKNMNLNEQGNIQRKEDLEKFIL